MADTTNPYRELFHRSADAILLLDSRGFIDCNDAAVELFGFTSREQVLQVHPAEISPPTQPDGRPSLEKADEMIGIARREGRHRFAWLHQRADNGRIFPAEVQLTAVQLGDRIVLHSIVRDMTEHQFLEEQLRQAQKMEAIGKLAGGIAHDFNNLLVVILGHAELLAESSLGDEDRDHVRAIEDAGERAAGLVRQLLAFSRKETGIPEVVELNAFVDRMRRLLARLIGEDLVVRTELAAEPLHIRVDPGQIEQVVLNLVSNARDASPDGGTLVIATGRATVGDVDPEPRSPFALEPGTYAVLSVTDAGMGMEPEIVDRAFEPFFTTKELGRGTGLGLSTVFGIVQACGGDVEIDSEVGRGTTVTVRIPITESQVPQDADPARHERPMGGGQCVLVVEDEEAVRVLIERVLVRRGYHVLTAQNGLEGERIFRERSDEIDLLVTDVIMPGLGGPELVAALARDGLRPPVVFLSGYAADALDDMQSEEYVDLLEKPFSADELTDRVRRALERGSDPLGVPGPG